MFVLIIALFIKTQAQHNLYNHVQVSEAGLGWAGNSINAVVFRRQSIASFGDIQVISYYDNDGYVVLGKRNLPDTSWQLQRTHFVGNIKDAHNSISIILDGEGYLHMAWDHHNGPLKYTKSVAPLSLDMADPVAMISTDEQKVSYPEFYKMPDGNLLFFYRDGGSGNGNLMINKYHTATQTWSRLQNNLIDGEGQRNAYWQACVDAAGTIHISWVWRESPEVSSNHDLCYARSKDGGITWQKSTGANYQLPITQATAEVAVAIPQKSNLINQTAMCADVAGVPMIASYWNDSAGVPQYQVVYKKGKQWAVENIGASNMPFVLGGVGTKKIPISRPQIICSGKGKNRKVHVIFRTEERGNHVTVASSAGLGSHLWKVKDLYAQNTGSWEPSYDIDRWNRYGELHLFVQQVFQADAEGLTRSAPQPVRVVSWKF